MVETIFMVRFIMEWSRNMTIVAVVVMVVVVHRVVMVLAVVLVTIGLLVKSVLQGQSFQLVGAGACGSDVEVHVEAMLLLPHQILDVHGVRLILQVAILLQHSKLAERTIALPEPEAEITIQN